MSVLKSRVVAVVAAVSIIGFATTTGAVAAKMITGKDIKNGTVTSADIKNNSLKSADIKNGSVAYVDLNAKAKSKLAGAKGEKGDTGEQGPAGQDGQDGADAVFAPYVDTLDAPKAIANIGGKINDNNTDLETGFTLPAGTYLINVSGSFLSQTAASTDVAVYPQLSLWLDKSGDGAFQWQEGEGDISPNALMPLAADRHISVSGQTVVTLEEETEVGLLGFGYAADQSSKRSGEINVDTAVITATPINAG